MQRWPQWLGTLAPGLQRLIAASQRISLPRGCGPDERLARLRAALCRPAAVRAVYFTLAPDEQAALQVLRQTPRGLTAEELARCYGPIRPLTALRTDRRPQSISERLLLLGWLLPRPVTRNHPLRYLLAPEVRAWLPVPLGSAPSAAPAPTPTPDVGSTPAGVTCAAPVPTPALPLALTATTAILSLAAAWPLQLRADGTPTATTLRHVQRRMPALPPTELAALIGWLMPVLTQAGLLAPHGSQHIPSPAASRFLAAPPAARVQILTTAWVATPRPDRWLTRVRVNQRGLDWAALRRRLMAWAEAATTSATHRYADLAAALGPLVDGVTHGLATPRRRSPWTPRRAAAVWDAALHGPLAWLGCNRSATAAGDESAAVSATQAAWHWRDDQTLVIPSGVGDADRLILAPFVARVEATATGEQVTLHARSLARAMAQGHDPARLRAVLCTQSGRLPANLEAILTPCGGLRMVHQTLVLSDDPAALTVALRRRSARRAVQAQLAPGVALVVPGAEAALARALARDGRTLVPPPPGTSAPPADLTAHEAARLGVAAALYTAYAPVDAPPGPAPELCARLLACLNPALRASTEQLIQSLRPPMPSEPVVAQVGGSRLNATAEQKRHAAAAEQWPSDEVDPGNHAALPAPNPTEHLAQLRQAIRRRQTVELTYQGATDPVPLVRPVRPLRLERHATWWYLHAYCLQARAERCFRLDRLQALH
ncbi:MAG: WYL domain-containing protein, partial [Oscillochloridaceae bacterium umkhey_bin13]